MMHNYYKHQTPRQAPKISFDLSEDELLDKPCKRDSERHTPLATKRATISDFLKRDEGASKRRKLDEQVSTQISVRTQDTEGSVTPQGPTPKKSIGLSAATLKQIRLAKQGIPSPRDQPMERPSPLSQETSQLIKTLKMAPVKSPDLKINMREKHEQLLAQELVLPLHFNKLLQLARYLDGSINFLKSCRRDGHCTFDDLKKSIESSYGR